MKRTPSQRNWFRSPMLQLSRWPLLLFNIIAVHKRNGTEKRDLTFFRFVVLQIRMHSPLFGLQTCVFAGSFLKISTSLLRTAKALARLRLCAGSPEPLLVAFVISTLFSCGGSIFQFFLILAYLQTLVLSTSFRKSFFACRFTQTK